jgi:hypothetical protein
MPVGVRSCARKAKTGRARVHGIEVSQIVERESDPGGQEERLGIANRHASMSHVGVCRGQRIDDRLSAESRVRAFGAEMDVVPAACELRDHGIEVPTVAVVQRRKQDPH